MAIDNLIQIKKSFGDKIYQQLFFNNLQFDISVQVIEIIHF